jgi:hypothetical protein
VRGCTSTNFGVPDGLGTWELEEAAAGGLLSRYKLQNARRGLDRLLGLVKNGELMPFLNNGSLSLSQCL